MIMDLMMVALITDIKYNHKNYLMIFGILNKMIYVDLGTASISAKLK
jgi:hypothetical protein